MKQTMIACLLFAGFLTNAQSVNIDTVQLRELIHAGLERFNIPGLSIAIVKDSSFVFQQGYGRTRSFFGKPVSAQSIFNVASLSKPVAAYTSLRYLLENGLSPDTLIDHPEKISYRNLLSHTAGFSNFLRDEKRKPAFKPGSEYCYSGVGYMVLQENITARAGITLDSLATKYVFSPADMPSSYFGDNKKESEVVPGHIPLLRSVMPFVIPFFPAFVVTCLLAFLLPRLFKRKASLRSSIIFAAIIALISTLLFLQIKGGSFNIAFYFTGLGLLVLLFLLLILFCISLLLRKARKVLRISAILFIIICYLGLLFIAREKPVPIKNPVIARGNAASSLRTNAADMSKFISYLLKKKNDHDDTIEMMITPQVKAGEQDDWGLGLGLRKHNGNIYAWHWGSNPGNRAIIVIDFKQNYGFCIMCNSGNGKKLLEELAKYLTGNKDDWKI